MREFNKFERVILQRISEIKSKNDIKQSSLMTIIQEELSAFAVEWSVPGDEKQFVKFIGNVGNDSILLKLLDIICLLTYLRNNGLILLLKTQGKKDRCLYDREKYVRRENGEYWTKEQEHIFMGNPVIISGFTAQGSYSIHTNLPEYLDEFVYALIYPTQELADLVNNNFITPEQRRFEEELIEAKKQTKYSRWAFVVSFIALIVALILPFYADTKLAEKDEIIKAIQSTKTELPCVIETKTTNDTVTVDLVNPQPIKTK